MHHHSTIDPPADLWISSRQETVKTTHLSSFLALFGSVLLLMAGSSLLSTFLSLRMAVAGFSEPTIGLIMAGYYGGMVLGAFVCQDLIQRVGHIRAFASFAAVATVSVMLHFLYIDALAWGLLRLVTGAAMMGLCTAIESWLNECALATARGRVFSVYMIIVYTGNGLGQFLLRLNDIHGQTILILVGILFTLALVPVSATNAISPQTPKPIDFNLGRLFRWSPLGMIGCLTAGILNGAFYAMAPVFAHTIGFSVLDVSWFMGITVFSGLLLQWPIGLLSDHFNRCGVLAAQGGAVAVVSLAMGAAAAGPLPLVLLLTAVYGASAFSIYPVAVARAHDRLDPDEIVAVSAALILFFGIGAVLGPILASVSMTLCGPAGLYVSTALTGGFLCAVAFYVGHQKPVAVADQADFFPMSGPSSVASELDPRLGSDL